MKTKLKKIKNIKVGDFVLLNLGYQWEDFHVPCKILAINNDTIKNLFTNEKGISFKYHYAGQDYTGNSMVFDENDKIDVLI